MSSFWWQQTEWTRRSSPIDDEVNGIGTRGRCRGYSDCNDVVEHIGKAVSAAATGCPWIVATYAAAAFENRCCGPLATAEAWSAFCFSPSKYWLAASIHAKVVNFLRFNLLPRLPPASSLSGGQSFTSLHFLDEKTTAIDRAAAAAAAAASVLGAAIIVAAIIIASIIGAPAAAAAVTAIQTSNGEERKASSS